MKKRLISLLLILTMLSGMVPAFLTTAAAADEGNTDSKFNSIIGASNVTPDGFDANDTTNPYNARPGQPFLISEQNEIFIFRSADIQDNGHNGNHVFVGDSLDTDLAFDKLMNIAGNFNDGNVAISGLASGSAHTVNSSYTMSYMEAVAFDPFATGRKDHVAYVGYDHNLDQTRVVVVDTNGYHVADTTVAASGVFFGTGENDTVGQHEATGFISITAGHYSNSYNGDRLVVYAHGAGNSATLVELTLNANKTLSKVSSQNNFLMNSSYTIDPGTGGDFKKRLSWRLAADLTSGDFNGDGIDDLAVVSQMHRPHDDKATNYPANVFLPYVGIAFGGGGNIVRSTKYTGKHIYTEATEDSKKYRSMVTGAGIDAGDIDGDGVDEIVMTGVSASVEVASSGKAASKNGPVPNPSLSRMAVISGKGNTISQSIYNEFDSPKILREGNGFNKDDKVWQSLKPTCVAVNGQNNAEFIFYMGYMISLEPGKQDVDIRYTQPYFESAKGGGVDQVFIQSAAAANFDANDLGREQLIYVIGLKRADKEDCSHELGFISASKYTLDGSEDGTKEDPSKGIYGTAAAFDSNDPYENNLTSENGSEHKKKVNAFVVAIDNDSDGVMATYKGKGYIYTDPQVKAVLQAAPYFGELSEYADMVGSTAYTIATSYTLGTSSGQETSWSVGVAADIETPVCDIAMEAGYVGSFSKEFTQENTVTYTNGFTATSEDMVVIERVPLQVYEYEVLGQKGTSTLSVQVPMDPTYTTLSIDGYNKFVDEYNAYVDDAYKSFDRQNANTAKATANMKLKKITADYLTGNEGNPWKYVAAYNGFTAFSNTTASLGHVSGSSDMAYDNEDAVGESVSSSHGFSVGLSVLFGANTPFGGATFGITSSMEQSFSTGSYKNTASTQGTQGEVTNIPSNSITALSENVLSAYNFSWKYGKWDLSLTGDSSILTPVYGYQLTGLSAPAAVVTDLDGTLSEDSTSVTLTWSAPDISKNSGRKSADGYYVYRKEPTGTYTKLNVTPTGNATDGYTATVTGLSTGTDVQFVVAGYIGNQIGAYSNTFMTNTVSAAIANAMAAAQKAQQTADKAKTAAQKALQLAELAAENTTESRVAAEIARDEAEAARDAAEAARMAAELAQTAAETARTAAETARDEAAASAAEAALTAADVAEEAARAAASAAESAASAAEAAEAAANAQDAKAAAEAAQKAAEEAAGSTEGNKTAAEAAQKAAEEAARAAEKAFQDAKDAIANAIGPQGPQGEKGDKGDKGEDGREVEFRTTETHIQWKYNTEDESAWRNLVALADITGAQGEKGDKGDKGDKGEVGAVGITGAKGEKGDTGETGAQGPQGEKGDTGETGAQGPKGDKGDTGETGAQGPQGEKGDTGETGAQGPQGEKGDTGETGAQGEKGDTGAQGEKGDKGDKGDTGAQGDTGKDGIDGVTVAAITIGSLALLGNLGWGVFFFTKRRLFA